MDAWFRGEANSLETPDGHAGTVRGGKHAGQGAYGAEFMRLTVFWERMADHFGPGYADTFARDHVMAELGGRTVHEALNSGWEAKDVWRVVCAVMNVPGEKR